MHETTIIVGEDLSQSARWGGQLLLDRVNAVLGTDYTFASVRLLRYRSNMPDGQLPQQFNYHAFPDAATCVLRAPATLVATINNGSRVHQTINRGTASVGLFVFGEEVPAFVDLLPLRRDDALTHDYVALLMFSSTVDSDTDVARFAADVHDGKRRGIAERIKAVYLR